MIKAGVEPTAIVGFDGSEECSVTYTPNTDALPESFEDIDRTVNYKPNIKKLPTRF